MSRKKVVDYHRSFNEIQKQAVWITKKYILNPKVHNSNLPLEILKRTPLFYINKTKAISKAISVIKDLSPLIDLRKHGCCNSDNFPAISRNKKKNPKNKKKRITFAEDVCERLDEIISIIEKAQLTSRRRPIYQRDLFGYLEKTKPAKKELSKQGSGRPFEYKLNRGIFLLSEFIRAKTGEPCWPQISELLNKIKSKNIGYLYSKVTRQKAERFLQLASDYDILITLNEVGFLLGYKFPLIKNLIENTEVVANVFKQRRELLVAPRSGKRRFK